MTWTEWACVIVFAAVVAAIATYAGYMRRKAQDLKEKNDVLAWTVARLALDLSRAREELAKNAPRVLWQEGKQ